MAASPALPLYHVHFEVFGKVQRVFMRKHTVIAATKLGVSGYVFNTERGSVKGEACGMQSSIENFQLWLRTKGSPKARVDRAEFSPATQVTVDPFDGEFVKRVVMLSNGSQFASRKAPLSMSKKSSKEDKIKAKNRGVRK